MRTPRFDIWAGVHSDDNGPVRHRGTPLLIQNTVKIPLLSEISKYSDNGTPIALVLPAEHSLSKLYTGFSSSIVKELEKEVERIFVFYNTAERKIVV